ncbi:hypothetical protein BOX15_Mlig008937g1 [Macrostomum lignano]|uniref:Major facilitator superfamily (MFS) profile domain-containing protein n=1 Tax=Macrostomum lignano TaxID=282301 RepID=A0A267EFE6_9PLAT|nr:hypothetical protein BOX15_Mlig008937g1 [Macrostomum lignano]
MAKRTVTPWLILSCFITCFGSSMLYGYNISVFNGPKDHIMCFLSENLLQIPCKDLSKNAENGKDANGTAPETAVDEAGHKLGLYYSLIMTVWIVFGAIGAFSTGAISNFFGRRNGLLFNNAFMIAGAIISAPTVATKIPYLLYIGRAFIGFNCGVTIGLASIYLTEIAPIHIRGAIGACHQLAVTIGILVAFVCSGLKQTMNHEDLWIVAQALTGVPAIISLIVLPFCPESPRFLFMNKGRIEDAKKALERLYPGDNPEDYIEEMRQEMQGTCSAGECAVKDDADDVPMAAAAPAKKFHFVQLFTQADLRMPVAIAVGIQIMQQLSGINAVMSYSSTMMETSGIHSDYVPYVNLGFSFFNVVCTVASLPLLEKFGRRTLLLVPSAILAVSLVVLCASAVVVSETQSPDVKRIVSIVFMGFIFVYIAGFAFGLGTIPGFIVAEVFRQEPRSAAYSLSQGVQWISNLIVSTTFVNLNLAIQGYVFLIYLSVVVPFWIFFFVCMPETKNRSFDDIANDLAFTRLCRGANDAQVIEDGGPDAKPMSSNMSLLKADRIEKKQQDTVA